MARFTSTFAHVFSRTTERPERPSTLLLAAREPLDLLERLVASATGATTEPAGAVAT